MTTEPLPRPDRGTGITWPPGRYDLYDLIDRLCTLDQIQGLLRRYKASLPKEAQAEVLITNDNKSATVFQNLRSAVVAGHIPEAEAYALLQGAEETGEQHVFYYIPGGRAEVDALSRGEAVAVSLWGADWRRRRGFPRLELVKDRYVWADFRIGQPGTADDRWLGKVYGHEVHEHQTNPVPTAGGMLYEVVEEYERVVCVVRSNRSPRGGGSLRDLLEIRIPRTATRALLMKRLSRVWELLAPALDPDRFKPWELAPARLRLLREAPKHKDLYRVGDVRLKDSRKGVTDVSPWSEAEALYRAKERRDAVRSFLAGKAECVRLIVTWLPKKPWGRPIGPVRTLIGPQATNEVVVPDRVHPEVLDYVTDQLRSFS